MDDIDDIERESIKIIVTNDDLHFNRIDQFLASKLPDLSRSLIKKLFEDGHIYLAEEKLEIKKSPKLGMEIIVDLPPPAPVDIEPQNIPLDILFEDEFLVIINKPAGLVIHPAPGNPNGTLVNAILYHCPDLKGIGNEKRPGIVHRLDKGTTGVMVVAKEQKCHEALVKMFAAHSLTRKYEAIVVGKISQKQGKLESMIGRHTVQRLKMSTHTRDGKKAITHYQVLHQNGLLAHVEFTLHTGRTHQIRVHATELLKTPLLGDLLYANVNQQKQRIDPRVVKIIEGLEHPLLHAKTLAFIHPMTNQELNFTTPAPAPMSEVLKVIYE